MRTVIDRAMLRAAGRAPDHTLEVDAACWSIVGDAAAMERTVLNLLDNAIKFSPAGSVVAVRTDRGWLTVTDQGTESPKQLRQQVFERFWRVPGARALPGSGLGLAIVANTIAAHGGTVQFVDPPNGRGACALIELPAATGPARPQST